MDLKKIKALLEKYYNGETDLAEEKILQDYFNNSDISEDLIADRDIFLFQNKEMDAIQNIPDISEEIWNKISKEEILIAKKKNVGYIFLRIAASILIIFASFYLIKDQLINKDEKYQITDTYDTPEQAYEQTKQTLLYVSALLNNGTQHLEPIEKINESTQRLQPLSSFNNGLKELDQIKKYQIANKYIKQ